MPWPNLDPTLVREGSVPRLAPPSPSRQQGCVIRVRWHAGGTMFFAASGGWCQGRALSRAWHHLLRRVSKDVSSASLATRSAHPCGSGQTWLCRPRHMARGRHNLDPTRCRHPRYDIWHVALRQDSARSSLVLPPRSILRCRSTSRIRGGAGGSGSGRSRSCACTRSTCR